MHIRNAAAYDVKGKLRGSAMLLLLREGREGGEGLRYRFEDEGARHAAGEASSQAGQDGNRRGRITITLAQTLRLGVSASPSSR